MVVGQTIYIGLPAQAEQSLLLAQTNSEASPERNLMVPPEVIPLDSDAVGKSVGNQAKIREFVMGATTGHLSGIDAPDAASASMDMNAQSGTQSAKHIRQAAINSLMGHKELAAQTAQFQPLAPQGGGLGLPLMDPNQQTFGQLSGQPDWLSGADQGQLTALGNAAQSQTLTAGSRSPRVLHDIRRAGASNNVSGAAALGAGLLYGGSVRRPNSLLGLGITGLTLTGFGVRQGFRF